MKLIRFLSALLTFCLVLGALIPLSIFPVFADDAADEVETENQDESEENKEDGEEEEEEEVVTNYLTKKFYSMEEKLETMELVLDRYGYQLYYEDYTGEVAVVNKSTGQILSTNPYDVAVGLPNLKRYPSDNIKNQLLSQIIIKFSGGTGDQYMYSFVEAAQRNQITRKNVKNGIRVEYIMGRQETRKLVPKLIPKERLEELIYAYITDETKLKFLKTFYILKDPDADITDRERREMQAAFPITREMAVYTFDDEATERELNKCEAIIKEFCPHYTYEQLEKDHEKTEYEGNDKDPALFRLALEYYLDEQGLSVRLPANSIRFDESAYSLDYIMILPYFGAGSSEYTGYTMIPDGAGTIVRFEDTLKQATSRAISGKLYGIDYAYHNIGEQHQQVMRLPLFGLVEDHVYGVEYDENGKVIDEGYVLSNGYVAIIEEGDALATIITDHGVNTIHKYNSTYTRFDPRPSDSYNLGSSISISGDATFSVTSDRKYSGSYRIRYIMLTDPNYAEENNITDYYETSYVGMAKAYRDYLISNEFISPVDNTNSDIPLYIETLGVTDVQERIMSVPVMVKKPLTTFENLKTMTSELNEAGINRIIYRLTGFINGGLENTFPTKIKFEKTIGGNNGYKDFLGYAAEKGVEVYPDFDISYTYKDVMFDDFSLKTDGIKTIDKRYTQKRTYSATLQYFEKTGLVAISPSVFDKLFGKLSKSLDKLGADGVSFATLGSDLNSDFDSKDPYNREDSKIFVSEVLAKIKEKYGKVMVDSGNAYTLPYVDHVLNVSLDSSNFTYASESIPLFGMIFHSYINFSGAPTNMAGDIRQEKLKILENGASPYFVFAYQNEASLKNNKTLSKYYSVSYSIWKEDLISLYNELNEVLSKVQYSPIKYHEFLVGNRIPTADELAADEAAKLAVEKEAEKILAEWEAEEERAKKYAERTGTEYVPSAKPVLPVYDDEGSTKYISDNGMIVRVTYENGYQFILNYNTFDVIADGYTISGLGYVVIEP